jgi:predicted HAD superfamily hydrolase
MLNVALDGTGVRGEFDRRCSGSSREWSIGLEGGSRGIIFASDMYLPSQFILEQLKSHGFWSTGDELYVSSEWRASKANGRLFSKILESERLQATSLLHTGDRRDADCEIPLTMGIKSQAQGCRQFNAV